MANRTEYAYRQSGDRAESVAPDWHWTDYMAILVDRLWIAVLVMAVVVACGVAMTRKQVPMYRATARIIVEEEAPKVLNIDDVMASGSRNLEMFNTHVLALNSRTIVAAALAKTGLDKDPRFAGGAGTPAARVAAALACVRVEPVPRSRLIDISVEHPDRDVAATFANGLAEQYIEANLNRRMESSMEAFGWLKRLADEYRAKIEAGRTAIHAYRKDAKSVSLEEHENIVVSRLKAVSEELTAAESLRVAAESAWQKVNTAMKARQPLGLQAPIADDDAVKLAQADLLRKQGEVSAARARYQEKHPVMIRAVGERDEMQAIYDQACRDAARRVESRYKVAAERVLALCKALEQQEREAIELDHMLVKYNEMKREVEADQQVYDAIAARMKDTKMAGDIKTTNIRLVDAAEPAARPFRPVWRRAILTSILVGLVLGVGVSFASYFLDDRLKRVEDVERELGLPVLSVVPPVKARAEARARVAEEDPQSPAAEAFRSLRASLTLRPEWPKGRRLLITSTTAGEGKSFVAGNLAIVLAHDGQRTVLVDGDMRRPTAHRIFEGAPKSGLADILSGGKTPDQVMWATPVPNLTVISAGRPPSKPSELLASPAMRQLLDTLGARFDRVIVDCPPVFGVSDPISLLPAMDGVVFVVHYGRVGRRAAARALAKIREGNPPVYGVVFNKVVRSLSSGYAYYYRYHSYGYAKTSPKPAK